MPMHVGLLIAPTRNIKMRIHELDLRPYERTINERMSKQRTYTMGKSGMSRSERESGNRSSDLVPTGISGLDEVLMGGVKSGNIILVEGPPGS